MSNSKGNNSFQLFRFDIISTVNNPWRNTEPSRCLVAKLSILSSSPEIHNSRRNCNRRPPLPLPLTIISCNNYCVHKLRSCQKVVTNFHHNGRKPRYKAIAGIVSAPIYTMTLRSPFQYSPSSPLKYRSELVPCQFPMRPFQFFCMKTTFKECQLLAVTTKRILSLCVSGRRGRNEDWKANIWT